MAKDPAFLFYSSDFLTGTMMMTDEQVGKYIRLMCLQHQKGHLSEKHMLSICKAYDVEIFDKFIKDEQGMYYNERLEAEIGKRRKYTESRRINALHPKNQKNNNEAYAQHMENENENEDVVINKGINKEKIDVNQPVPAIALEAAEMNQFTHTKNKNTEFIKEQWKVYLLERTNDPPAKRRVYTHDQTELCRYFLNWIRNKFPKHGTSKNGSTGSSEKLGRSERNDRARAEY